MKAAISRSLQLGRGSGWGSGSGLRVRPLGGLAAHDSGRHVDGRGVALGARLRGDRDLRGVVAEHLGGSVDGDHEFVGEVAARPVQLARLVEPVCAALPREALHGPLGVVEPTAGDHLAFEADGHLVAQADHDRPAQRSRVPLEPLEVLDDARVGDRRANVIAGDLDRAGLAMLVAFTRSGERNEGQDGHLR